MAGHSNHAQNSAAWAAMRAEQAAAAEQRRAERAAAKEARREANRAAWWGRYERTAAEHAEEAAEVYDLEAATSEELQAVRCTVDHAAPGEWHVTTTDGVGYEVASAGYVVTIDGAPYEVPSMEAARELIELAEATRRDEADEVASFADGMSLERGGIVYVIDHATPTTVTLRTIVDGGEMVHTHKVRRCPRGQYIRPGRSRFTRDIFAADMAA